jgi:hypothetical protein
MTAVEVCFRYATPPSEPDLRALQGMREVYGIRRLAFDEAARTVRVEFDATRLNEDTVAFLLRGAGLDLREKLALL